jgi:hypothetical protein
MGMNIKTKVILSVWALALIPLVAEPQIRRYNPETGTMTPLPTYGGDTGVSDEDIEERNQFYRTSRQNISVGSGVTMDTSREPTFAPPAGTFVPTQAPRGRSSMSDAALALQSGMRPGVPEGQTQQGPDPRSRYGFAIALIDTKNYGERRVFENLMRLEALDGILFRTYIKEETHKDPEQAAQEMPLPKWMMQYTGESPTFRFDKDNRLARMYQVKDSDYPVVIYQDPRGERRYFSIASSIESFRKKYDEVRREVDAQR